MPHILKEISVSLEEKYRVMQGPGSAVFVQEFVPSFFDEAPEWRTVYSSPADGLGRIRCMEHIKHVASKEIHQVI